MSFIIDLLPFFIVAGIAFAIGWNMRALIILHGLAQNPEHFIKMLEQIKAINKKEENGIPESAVALEIERVGNTLYAYSKETNQFMGQGPDLKTLLEIIHKRFPGQVFFGEISNDNPAKEIA